MAATATAAAPATGAALLERAVAFVKEELSENDASHDWSHIERVWKLARTLAEEEGESVDLELVELAAILHDVGDYKYSGSETAGEERIRAFLTKEQYAPARIDAIVAIVKGVSFKNELSTAPTMTPELGVVQDADRLDAIGAIGIARTFAYGAKKGSKMYDADIKPRVGLTSAEYAATKEDESTTINHFHEKLLLLKDMMKTDAGRRVAQARHDYMLGFLEQFGAEWEGKR